MEEPAARALEPGLALEETARGPPVEQVASAEPGPVMDQALALAVPGPGPTEAPAPAKAAPRMFVRGAVRIPPVADHSRLTSNRSCRA